MKIVCVGDCGVDLYLPAGDRCFGGITANFARHAANAFPAGDTIHVVSPVGDDAGGRLVRDAASHGRIDWRLHVLPGRTPVQTIEIEANGEKRFTHYDEGVLRDFRFDADTRSLIGSSDLLVAPVYLQIVGLFDELLAIPTRGRVAVDFADFLQHLDFSLLTRHVDRIDLGFFGLDAADTQTIDTLAGVAASRGKTIVVTLGADGSLAFRGSERYRAPALPVPSVVDTTGAGDAYAAAFLASYCHGADIPAAMLAGARLAARVVGHFGSYPA